MSNFGPAPSRITTKISPSVDPRSHFSSVRSDGCVPSGAIGPLPFASVPWQKRQFFVYAALPAAIDVAFDATGNAAAMSAGFDYVAHGGRYVFLSIVSDRISFSDPDFHRREMTLLASRNATLADFERVLKAMREGQVPTGALNTHRTRLDQLAEVLPTWMQPQTGVIKGIVEC